MLAAGLLLAYPALSFPADANPRSGVNSHASAHAPGAAATLIELNGPIGPAMSRYVDQAIADAGDQRNRIIILQMDTPGGLDTSMRDIIKAILASPVPVVAYVAPGGARAASAGTYILYASHIAAMAPATNLGAATPISIGGEPNTPPVNPAGEANKSSMNPAGDDKKSKAPPEIPAGSTSERKAVNDAVAYIRSLAQLRGRNAEWGEAAVRGAASLSADEALKQGVIEIVARNVPDLLQQLQGRTVKTASGEIVLETPGTDGADHCSRLAHAPAAGRDPSHYCVRAVTRGDLWPAARGL